VYIINISLKPDNDFYRGRKWHGKMNFQLLVTSVVHINGSKVHTQYRECYMARFKVSPLVLLSTNVALCQWVSVCHILKVCSACSCTHPLTIKALHSIETSGNTNPHRDTAAHPYRKLTFELTHIIPFTSTYIPATLLEKWRQLHNQNEEKKK
jgi:hypothetical protein